MGNVLHFLLSPWKQPSLKKPEPEEIHFIHQAFRAARRGDVETLQALTSHPDRSAEGNMPLAQVTDPMTNQTLLHAAMGKGSPQCVRFLLAKGCNLLKGDQSGETPLHAACMSDRLENLMVALEGEMSVFLEVRDMWNRTLLLKAMVYNSQRVLRYLLTRDVDVNARDVFSLTLVHMAVTHDRPDLVRLLVAQGADLDPLTDRGRSPLSMAITAPNPAMVRELLLLGASTRHTSSCQPSVTAIREFVRRLERGVVCRQAEEVLHWMLTAHGHLLHSDTPDVFQRVLYTADVHHYLPLMYKMLVCSDSMCDDLSARLSSLSSSSSSTSSLSTSSSSSPQQAGERQSQRSVLKLYDLARRSARRALMAGGRNVLWGVGQLSADVPPAVKGLLLLKDCDFKEFPTNVQH